MPHAVPASKSGRLWRLSVPRSGRSLLALVLFAACDPPAPPTGEACREFNYESRHRGGSVVCRMLWCTSASTSTSLSERTTGSMATLWCDEASEAGAAR